MQDAATAAARSMDTPFDLIGGAEGVRRLCERFYAVMAEDASAKTLRDMHGPDLGPITDKLTLFLTAWMGGPRDYFAQPEAPCIMSVHKRLPIGAAERDQWLHCMARALKETGASEEARAMLNPAFARIADAMRSQ
ncbi:MAG: group II truncated hemoglobin [Hyphomonadaceae bacterium]